MSTARGRGRLAFIGEIPAFTGMYPRPPPPSLAGRKSSAITCAKRMSQFLGDDRIRDKVCRFLLLLQLLWLLCCHWLFLGDDRIRDKMCSNV